ncbi:hypothetical protein DICVIV_05092 [Dictyocaulus viviparus]|uniref:Uncharacterized protein n=1 Tax=Dictyocaulus viviparus TaxID=29172 RepID=A0A0D8XY76_DICVI|nr:hypothetical protein DICVIV_05092 [Dictyocaulus viviparus]
MIKQNEQYGYCCLTIIALSIAFCSAVVTFLVADHMYTGIPCHDNANTLELQNEELSWSGSDRLVVISKRVVVVRMDDGKRCYVLPSHNVQDISRKKFAIIQEPLTQAIGIHVAGQEGWAFCNSLPMYLLEESTKRQYKIVYRKKITSYMTKAGKTSQVLIKILIASP